MAFTIYISIVVFLTAFGIYQYFYLTKIYFSNASLNKFRELKHESVIYLSENLKTNLSHDDIDKFRSFISIVSISINQINTAKGMRFKMAKSLIIAILACSHQIKTITPNDNIKLDEFLKRYWQTLSLSFRAIPFLRLRLIIFLLHIFSKLLLVFGLHKFKKVVQSVDAILKVDSDFNNHCLG